MAVARFQVVSLPLARAHPRPDRSASGEDGRSGGRRFTWRFLAANNRSLAIAADWYSDADTCLAALRLLGGGLAAADGEFSQDERGFWSWRVRVGPVVAASAQHYPRRLRAQLTCAAFVREAGQPSVLEHLAVVHRTR